ncbi:MAG: GNAT family N-acetyltransferase [Gammaproteobacteria bacterium]
MIVETERLLLRELTPEDLPFISEMLGDAEVMRFYPRPLDRKGSMDWIEVQRRRYTTDGFGFWLVVHRADGAAIGQAGLVRQVIENTGEAGLSYLMHKPFWRQGYAEEAARACLKYGFSLGLERIVCTVRPENEPSLALACKLGFREERQLDYKGYTHILFGMSRDGP